MDKSRERSQKSLHPEHTWEIPTEFKLLMIMNIHYHRYHYHEPNRRQDHVNHDHQKTGGVITKASPLLAS